MGHGCEGDADMRSRARLSQLVTIGEILACSGQSNEDLGPLLLVSLDQQQPYEQMRRAYFHLTLFDSNYSAWGKLHHQFIEFLSEMWIVRTSVGSNVFMCQGDKVSVG